MDVYKVLNENRTHTLAQVSLVLDLIKLETLDGRDALILASHLVNHGIASAGRYLAHVRAQLTSSAAIHYVDRLQERFDAIQKLPGLTERLHNADELREFYTPEGYLFRPGTTRPETAIVVFTTTYNNFGFSTAVLDTLLAQLGTARLYLKDTSSNYYLKGVKGLASDLRDLPPAIAAVLRGKGISDYIITGFSSGGFPGLYTAARMQPIGYIGYSILSDISDKGKLQAPRYFRDLRGSVPDEVFFSAEEIMSQRQPGVPFKIVYGDQTAIDRDHALNLQAYEGVELVVVPESKHEVTGRLLELGRFNDLFTTLLEGAGR